VSSFQINAQLRPDVLRPVYQRCQRIHIPAFLSREGAAQLHAHLRDELEWSWAFNRGATSYDLSKIAQEALAPPQRQQIEQAICAGARQGFQYSYDACRVPDDAAVRAADNRLLCRFGDFLNSTPLLDFARALTGAANISFADAQATRYGAGHFLTAHNDAVAGKNRVAAYVLSLTEEWPADWGGQLQFIDNDGHIAEAYVPRFNALNVFSVPQLHAVSVVAPFVSRPRFSITGWLRHT
jgi:Rps23 Pro-64 3,4-dihydroxylase Tpa1-like proline 4-hydroxylase